MNYSTGINKCGKRLKVFCILNVCVIAALLIRICNYKAFRVMKLTVHRDFYRKTQIGISEGARAISRNAYDERTAVRLLGQAFNKRHTHTFLSLHYLYFI